MTSILTNGLPDDDLMARNLMSHGVYLNTNPARQIGGSAYTSYLALAGSGGGMSTRGPGACEAKLAVKFDLASKVSSTALNGGDLDPILGESGEPPCSFSINHGLLSDLRALSDYPFVFNYSFDSYGLNPVFPGSSGDVFYGQLEDAADVVFVQVLDLRGRLLKHESNTSALTNFGFAFEVNSALRGEPIMLSVSTKSGGVYEILVEVPDV